MTDEQQYDAPNQQVVRGDGSAPWDEGTGGGEDVGQGAAPEGDDQPGVDDMSKAELLDEAEARGVDVDASMTKAEIRAAIA